MVLVDTSAWIEFFRRDGDLLTKLSVKGLLDVLEASLCGPVEMEFFGGAHSHEIPRIKEFFHILPYLENDHKVWRKAADHFQAVRKLGHTVPWNDVLIATIARERNISVFAKDKHFPIIAEAIGVRLYEPGYNGKYNPGEG